MFAKLFNVVVSFINQFQWFDGQTTFILNMIAKLLGAESV